MRTIDADALLKVLGLGANCEECEESVRGVYCAANPDLMDVCDAIADAPTIEPKRGRWEDVEEVLEEGITDGTPYTIMSVGYKCSECGTEMGYLWSFCPNCGAKMDDDWEEPEINPCRGCDDYDGRGGCKSHGGCGAERSEE